MEGTKMNITYDYYLISHASEDIYPAWIKSERYDYLKTSHVSYHSSEENNIIKKQGYIEYPYFFNLSSIC